MEAVEVMATLRGQAAAEDLGGTLAVDQAVVAAEARVAQVVLEAQAAAALMAARGGTTVEDEAVAMVSLLQVEVPHHQVATQVAVAPVRPAIGRRELTGAGLILRCWRSCGKSLTRRKSSSRTT